MVLLRNFNLIFTFIRLSLSMLVVNNSKLLKSITVEPLYCEMASTKQIFGCDFEVFGKVQGVFFRKHTEKQAKTLGVYGWCMNTDKGTVKGRLEGPLAEINEMKFWLQNKGSPKSVIQRADFTPTKEISTYTSKNFVIRR